MTRLKLEIIQKFMRQVRKTETGTLHGTANALGLLVILSRYQDKYGYVQGVYYKDICKKLGCSAQTYYHSRAILEEMGLIRCEKGHRMDCDITIIGNDFPYVDNRNPNSRKNQSYINTNRKIFQNGEFYRLKVQEMYLLLMFLVYTESAGQHGAELYYIKRSEFDRRHMKLFGCSKKTLRGYLHTMKKFFPLKTRGGRLYVNAIRPQYNQPQDQSEEAVYTEAITRMIVRRERIEADQQAIKDTAGLMRQYKRYFNGLEENISAVVTVIHRVLKNFREALAPPLIHKILRDTYPDLQYE